MPKRCEHSKVKYLCEVCNPPAELEVERLRSALKEIAEMKHVSEPLTQFFQAREIAKKALERT